MQDIIELASDTIITLAPYFTKGSEAIISETGKNLYTWVKDKLNQASRQKELEAFSDTPNDARIQGRLEIALEEILKQDSTLVAELTKLVNAAKVETTTTVIGTNINTGTIKAGGSVIIGNKNTYK